jgi:integral membrane protein
MKPFDYFIYCFKNYAKFSGRACRSEFWFFVLFNFVISNALTIISQSLLWCNDDAIWVALIGNVYGLAVFIPSLAVTVRRLHDTGKSGWGILSYYLPILLTIVFFVVFFVQIFSEFSFYEMNKIRLEDIPWITVVGILLCLFLSLFFGIFILVWLCTDSQPGTNKYGPNPKEMMGHGFGNPQQQPYGQNPYGGQQPPYAQQSYGGMNAPQQPPYGAQQNPYDASQQPPYGSTPQTPQNGEGDNYEKDPNGGDSHYQR